MPGPSFDLKQALDCARITLTLYGSTTPPRRLLDHLDGLERLARGSAAGTESARPREGLGHELIGANEAGRILGCSGRYVRRISGDLDGRRIAGRWVFQSRAVESYAELRSESVRYAG